VGANSLPRRIVKRLASPLLREDRYSYLQTAAMAWDIWRGGWREPELDLLPSMAKPGDTVLDIGANYGLYAYHFSRAVGPSGRVYSFEPVPFTVATLRRVARVLRLGNVEIVPRGCSDQAGPVTFQVPLAATGTISAGLAYIGTRKDDHPGFEQQVRWKQTREVAAELVVLDDYLPPLADVSCLKIDIEGAEVLAFRGADKLIDQHVPTIICEINHWYLEGFGFSVKDLVDPLLAKGYELFFYDDARKRLRPTPVSEVVEDNYVLLHPKRRARLAHLLPA
jgi:FkbM family methyltransferase